MSNLYGQDCVAALAAQEGISFAEAAARNATYESRANSFVREALAAKKKVGKMCREFGGNPEVTASWEGCGFGGCRRNSISLVLLASLDKRRARRILRKLSRLSKS